MIEPMRVAPSYTAIEDSVAVLSRACAGGRGRVFLMVQREAFWPVHRRSDGRPFLFGDGGDEEEFGRRPNVTPRRETVTLQSSV
jgi:hypothetical protein